MTTTPPPPCCLDAADGLCPQHTAVRVAAERAERRAANLDPGARTGTSVNRFPEGTGLPPKLADLGVTKKASSTAQQMAKVPEEVFETNARKPANPPLPPCCIEAQCPQHRDIRAAAQRAEKRARALHPAARSATRIKSQIGGDK